MRIGNRQRPLKEARAPRWLGCDRLVQECGLWFGIQRSLPRTRKVGRAKGLCLPTKQKCSNKEIGEKLEALTDAEHNGRRVIAEVVSSDEVYSGARLSEAPELADWIRPPLWRFRRIHIGRNFEPARWKLCFGGQHRSMVREPPHVTQCGPWRTLVESTIQRGRLRLNGSHCDLTRLLRLIGG